LIKIETKLKQDFDLELRC